MKNNTNYAFLMVDYKMPDFIRNIQDKIRDEELYLEDDGDYSYGLEKETHVTLVPCLDNDVDLEKIKGFLGNIEDYGIVLTDISKFENENYDVLKCAVKSSALLNTNKMICQNFETHSNYGAYNPHLTIAYMKCGMADKYAKNILPKLIYLEPTNFSFSYYDKDGKNQVIKFE